MNNDLIEDTFGSYNLTQELENLEWLELDNIPDELYNPFEDYSIGNQPDPVMETISILMNQEYLHFACKTILNIELLPFQAATLDVLWKKKFPMLIASRGASKSYMLAIYCFLRAIFDQGCKVCVVGAGFRQSRQVFDYMISIWDKAPILRDIGGSKSGPKREVDRCEFTIGDSKCYFLPIGDGTKIRGIRANYILGDEYACLGEETLVETNHGIFRIKDLENNYKNIKLFTGEKNILESPSKFIKTQPIDVYKIKTKFGYEFRCSDIHKVKTINGWKLAKDLSKNDWIIADNNYIFPDKNVVIDDLELNEDLAWLFGILISEGSISYKDQISVQMTDRDCIDRIEKIFNRIFPEINTGIYHRDAYIDHRGWDCKQTWSVYISSKYVREKLLKFGLLRSTAEYKIIPDSILKSPKNIIVSFLRGLFEGDGSCFKFKDREVTRLGISYYSVSKQLCSEVQFLLSKLDMESCIVSRNSKISKNKQWIVRLNGVHAKNLFNLLNIKKWGNIINECYIHEPENKGVVWAENCKKWKASIYAYGKQHDIGYFINKEEAIKCINDNKINFPRALKVVSTEKQKEKEQLYDFYLPEFHCFYGNGFRQHNSINEEIFNLVIQGFGAVSSSPVDKVKEAALINKLKKMGKWNSDMESMRRLTSKNNQIVYTGTAYYQFNHFYKNFKKFHKIISSKGDLSKLKDIFDGEAIPESFNWKDYAIVRIPYTSLPEGFLDEKIVAQAKATLDRNQFLMEFGAIFIADSDGFYKRSVIEGATTNKPILVSTSEYVQFTAMRSGSKDKSYVMAIDPAADQDNAAIVILEVYIDHRRVVHCWTTNRRKYNNFKKYMQTSGIILEDDYYKYIAKKIRSLMRLFNIGHIIMDKNGGGIAIQEALEAKGLCEEGELPIYEQIDTDEPKHTDHFDGLHILELLSPTNDINAEANHGMLKDLQDKVLLFPLFDTIELAKATELDNINDIKFDTYEDLVSEIEELKNEMTSIVVTPSSTLGKETFDTPSIKGANDKKGRLRKDRYSALLYANYYCRSRYKNQPTKLEYKAVGGTKDTVKMSSGGSTPMYRGFGATKFGKSNWLNSSTGAVFFKHKNN